ncbi:hypothetical protein B4135_3053 [Caldibacillus debilis]|uniref:Uncharacterized protein n=1 Tax=Caldibacillus debilis TaxID=301148 RepID=A0A150LKG4_9BACI|nr:hypothetical protein B4135_3053 [Caldibacillus debilis]
MLRKGLALFLTGVASRRLMNPPRIRKRKNAGMFAAVSKTMFLRKGKGKRRKAKLPCTDGTGSRCHS